MENNVEALRKQLNVKKGKPIPMYKLLELKKGKR